MRAALIVEDSKRDAQVAIEVLREAGLGDAEVVDNVSSAILRLNEVLEERRPAPDLLLVDLSFPNESGFEILRLWKSHPRLHKIPVVVWTVMGDTEQRLCNYFGVGKIVPKWSGVQALEQAVTSLFAGAGPTAG